MDPLAQLADIHLPDAINQSPISIGWWLLAALILVLITTLTLKWRKARQLRKAQRQALTQLKTDKLSAEQVFLILKASAMAYFPRQQVASLFGEVFIEFLNQQLPQKYQQQFLAQAKPAINLQYQAPNSNGNEQATNLQQAALLWVKHALPVNTQRIVEHSQEVIQK